MKLINTAGVTALLCMSALFATAQTPDEVANKVAGIATYERGQSRATLIEIEEILRTSEDKPKVRTAIALSLADLLTAPGATRDAKLFACRQLWILGSEPALDTLSSMLVNEQMVDLACYAIAKDPSARARQILREALPKAKGRPAVAIVNLLGERRDADAVGMLAGLVGGDDKQVAIAAVAALGKIGGEQAAQCLSAALKSEDAALRTAAMDASLRCAERLLGAGDRKGAVALYRELASEKYPTQARNAAQIGLENAKLGEPIVLFDGKTLKGWEGNQDWFRVEDGAIVAGSLDKRIPNNEFLCTERSFGDFELRVRVKLLGEGDNAGIQIRSKRVPNDQEVSGYQADMGKGYWGGLYDESRRNKILALPDQKELANFLNADDWNDYVIRCEGKHIQLWLNGYKTVDYMEPDEGIAENGIIGLQIHGGSPSQAFYKDIVIREIEMP